MFPFAIRLPQVSLHYSFLAPPPLSCLSIVTLLWTGIHISPFENVKTLLAIFAGKKYKSVTLKVRPVKTELPSRFRIVREIKGDPLAELPKLPTRPADYEPTGHYTLECKEQFDKIHASDFLLPEERKLMHQFMCLQNEGFAWNDLE